MRLQEMAAYQERLKMEAADQVEGLKQKYNDYKNKLKKANISIQTLSSRLAK